jgi:5-methyltetrahydropteroyltriglutamate--homocysteine methyltransferase
VAQGFSPRQVKITVPGPVTITDTVANRHYADDRSLAFDLAAALNFEIRALAAAGCEYIQVDEPLFARKVDAALDYGIECLERCFDGVPDHVTRVVHICCGYPNHLDDRDYHKADPESYFRLAHALDGAAIHQVSIEDAHRHNDLTLLDEFRDKTVVFGVVAVAKSRVEAVEEVAMRLTEALDHIDRSRLVAAPDCGLGLLGQRLARAKLAVLCEAARSV